IELRAVDSAYPLYGNVELAPDMPLSAAFARRDGVWGAVADANLLYRLGIEAPDSRGERGPRVRIGEAVYEIRAVLAHEPDRSTRITAFGPHVLVSEQSLPETGLVRPGSLLHYHYRLRLPPGSDAAALRADLEETFPEAGWRIRDAGQAAPGVERFVERLGLFLTLVGLTALLVGGLGVANAVRSYLDGRVATIATLKCLGAPGGLILRVYLVQIMILALGGTAVGIALGAVAPFALRTLLSGALGFEVLAGFYVAPLVVATAFGLLTALAFSLWPLAQARGVPAAALFRARIAPVAQGAGGIGWPSLSAIGLVALALAALTILTAGDQRFGAWFVLGAVAALLLFRTTALGIMALARRMPRPRRATLRLALTNLHRPGATTPSVLLSLGLGLTVLVALAQIQANLERQIGERMPQEAPGFYFIDIQPDQVAPFEALVLSTPGVRELERVPMLRGRITEVRGVPVEDLEIPPDIAWVFRGDRGLTWSAEPPEGAELTRGDWWPPDYQGPPLVSLDAEVGRAMDLAPGDSLTLNILGREVAVEIANLREVDWTGLGINFVMVLSPGLLESAPQTHIATVKADPAVEAALERAITDRFANVSSIRVKEALAAVAEILAQIGLAVRLSASVAILAGILVLAGAIAAGHRRRVYDAVVLKVLGATRAEMARAFLLEYGLLGL
ncbi:MAG TPA: FtsX-like permease family protein, partial [Kiloniellales bacterium]|nr:FtsX-like permease family protein [Kiloniellales bacterium]